MGPMSFADSGAAHSEENWKGCLDALHFFERKSPNGGFVVYDDDKVPMWRYATDEEKERLYYFLMGVEYQRMLDFVFGKG